MEAASSRVTAFMNVVDVINGNGSIAPARFHKHATAVACLQSHAGPSAKVHAHIFFILRPYTLTDPTWQKKVRFFYFSGFFQTDFLFKICQGETKKNWNKNDCFCFSRLTVTSSVCTSNLPYCLVQKHWLQLIRAASCFQCGHLWQKTAKLSCPESKHKPFYSRCQSAVMHNGIWVLSQALIKHLWPMRIVSRCITSMWPTCVMSRCITCRWPTCVMSRCITCR